VSCALHTMNTSAMCGPQSASSDEIFVFPRRKASGRVSRSTGKRGEAPSACARSKRQRHPTGFTYAKIAQAFDRPQAEAAAAFGISITTMKHICRRFGLDRWPYRRPRRAALTSVPPAQCDMQIGFRRGQGNTACMRGSMKPAGPVDSHLQAFKSRDGDVDRTPEICTWREAPAKLQAGSTATHSVQLSAHATIPSACTEAFGILFNPPPISCEAPIWPALPCHPKRFCRREDPSRLHVGTMGVLRHMGSTDSLLSMASTVGTAVSELSEASGPSSCSEEDYRLHVSEASSLSSCSEEGYRLHDWDSLPSFGPKLRSEQGSLDRRLPTACHKDCVCVDDEGDVEESLGWLVYPDDALARGRAEQQPALLV